MTGSELRRWKNSRFLPEALKTRANFPSSTRAPYKSYFFFGGLYCVSAEAAVVLAALLLVGFDSTLLATVATRLEVVSLEVFFVAMIGSCT